MKTIWVYTTKCLIFFISLNLIINYGIININKDTVKKTVSNELHNVVSDIYGMSAYIDIELGEKLAQLDLKNSGQINSDVLTKNFNLDRMINFNLKKFCKENEVNNSFLNILFTKSYTEGEKKVVFYNDFLGDDPGGNLKKYRFMIGNGGYKKYMNNNLNNIVFYEYDNAFVGGKLTGAFLFLGKQVF